MKISFVQAVQWVGAAMGIALLVGLNFEYESDAGMRINSSVDDSLSQGIRGYWKLDEGTGTNATDSSGNGNTLAFTGSPAWTTPAQIGPYMLDFSGTGQYLSVASPASGVLDFAAGASFTISGWFNRDSSGRTDTIVAKRNGIAASDDGYIVYIGADNSLYFEASDTDDTDEYQMVSSSTFTSTGWHQFAVSWNDAADATKTNPVNIYIDGALNNGSPTGTFGNIGSLVESVAFRIGAESDAGNPFDGKLDDIRVYGYPLSANDVLKLYQTTAPAQPVDTGLVGHWTFDGPDIKGTTAIDRSGKGNNGTITGAVPAIGKLGQGLSFNGTNDYVNVADPPGGELDFEDGISFTVSVWFNRRTTSSGSDCLFMKKVDGSDYQPGFSFYFFSDGFEYLALFSDGVDQFASDHILSSLVVGTWYHLVSVWNDTTQTYSIYINGAYQTGDTNTGSPINSLANDWYFTIGSGWNESMLNPFDGKIDDVRVYNRALSETEITYLYNLGR